MRRSWITGLLVVLLLAGGAAFFFSIRTAPEPARPIAPVGEEVVALAKALDLIRPSRSQAAKEFTVSSPNGRTLRLADYTGQVVFLNFWATWCPPCKEEMPAMERLYRRYKERGFVVLALSVDAEGAPVVVPFVKEHQLTFPIGLDPTMAVADRYGVRGLPTSFLVDREGGLVALALGPREWNGQAAQALVEALLR